MKLKTLFGLSILVSTLFWQIANADTVRLTSLDWPPYTGDYLPEQGASVAVARAAFAAVGHELKVDFFPWKRAVGYGKENPDYDGYFPEYYAKSLEEDFVLSEPMGHGPLGFAQLNGKEIKWNTLADLNNYKIGIVSGYVNTAEFDNMVASGQIQTDAANSDLKNLQKLLGGRIQAAVIDANVMSFLLNTTPELKDQASKISFNDKNLENKALFICFKKNERGRQLAIDFNKGLTMIDVESIMQSYLK